MSDLFHFSLDIPVHIEAEIQSKLDAIERDHAVRFLFAIESGSRAWGFPSPDSDYDVRFVYAQERNWYLSVFPSRDVIELPIDGDWDINGWDIQKAIALLLKPNPVLLEWLSSPIRYRWDEDACSSIKSFADQYVMPQDCLNHYFHLARNGWQRNISNKAEIKLKKYFYVLRPALAIRWIRSNPDMLPPMNFQALIEGTDVSKTAQNLISDLLAAKAKASEVGVGKRIPLLDTLIVDELAWAEDNRAHHNRLTNAVRQRADDLFRCLIGH